MVTDYYVNVNGKKVLYSTLDSNLKKSLDQQGITETEAARQNIDTSKSYEQQIKDYYERDHVVKQGSKEVSVPGRYAEQFGIAKPDREATRKAIQEKERAEKKAAKEKRKKSFG